MTSQLKRAKLVMNSFITDKETKEAFELLWKQIQEQNKDNVMAHIPVGQVDVEARNISEMTYFEHYEILSSDRVDDEGNVFESQEAYDIHIEGLANEKFSGWDMQLISEEDGIKTYYLFDNEGLYKGEFNSEEGIEYFIRVEKQDWIDEQTAYDELDYEYHEVYWNTVWRFNDYMDNDVAVEVGLGVLEIYHEDNDEFLFLRGCGMDLSPQLMAYQALTHGYIDEKYLDHFRDIDYTKYVLGNKLFEKVVRKLGVERFFQV